MTNDMQRTTIYVPAQLWETFSRLAKLEHRSRTSMLVVLMEQFCNDHEKQEVRDLQEPPKTVKFRRERPIHISPPDTTILAAPFDLPEPEVLKRVDVEDIPRPIGIKKIDDDPFALPSDESFIKKKS